MDYYDICKWDIEDKKKSIKKCYENYDIDGLMKIKEEFEETKGVKLGYAIFKSLVIGLGFEKSIDKAENLLNRGELNMNDFLITELTNVYNDVKKGITHTYDNANWIREDLQKVIGRIETIVNLLQNKTITVKYKEGE